MSIDIAPGAGLTDLTEYSIPVWSSAVVNKTVTAADPTNPRKDIVVRYVDMTAYAPDNNLSALKFIIVSGVAAGSPSDPTDLAIQTAVGAGNPWEKLARITLPHSVSSVLNAYITDLRTPVAFAGRLWGGSSNTIGHSVPNVADDTVALLGASQTFSGTQTFSGPVNIGSVNIAGVWQSWTPVWTNFTLGASTLNYAKYTQVGKTTFFRLSITLGAGYSISGQIIFSSPTTQASDAMQNNSYYFDTSAGTFYQMIGIQNSSTTIKFYALNATASIVFFVATSNTSPVTTGVGDTITISGSYESV